MKILVAGACGMVGQNLVHLLERKYKTKIYTADLKHGVDLREPKECRIVTRGCDQVFHLADRTVGIGYSSTHHGQMMTDSLLISLNLLEAARKNGVNNYLYTSSSCVYSEDFEIPVTEHMAACGLPEEANWGYGTAKRIAEQQCYHFVKEYGMRIVIVRPANIYGPSYLWNRKIKDMHVIPALISKMIRGDKEIVVWGNGSHKRTFQYESDTAFLMSELMDKGVSGEAYNLGGNEYSVHDLIMKLSAITGWKGIIRTDESKPTGPARKAQNTDRLQCLLGEIESVDGFKEMVEAARKARL